MQIHPADLEVQVIRRLVAPAGKKVLQVGCYSGRVMKALLGENTQLTGVELQCRKCQAIKRRFPEVQMIRGNFLKVDLFKLFDLIVFSRCLHHFDGGLEGKIEALHKAKSMLIADGQILVIEPSMDNTMCQLAELFIEEEQGIVQAFVAMNRSDLQVVRNERVVIDYSFDNFDDLCREFFMADGYEVLGEHVRKMRDFLEIEDDHRPIHFSEITNLYVLQ